MLNIIVRFLGLKDIQVNDFVLFVLFREYLATFKKTVAMHEVFLTRLAAHPTLRKDSNFNVFLEFKGEVCYQQN